MTRSDLMEWLYQDAVHRTRDIGPLFDALVAGGLQPWEIDAAIDAVVAVLRADMVAAWGELAASIE